MKDRFFVITGKTFNHRDTLKRLGCQWHQDRKVWYTKSSHVASMVKHYLRYELTDNIEVKEITEN